MPTNEAEPKWKAEERAYADYLLAYALSKAGGNVDDLALSIDKRAGLGLGYHIALALGVAHAKAGSVPSKFEHFFELMKAFIVGVGENAL